MIYSPPSLFIYLFLHSESMKSMNSWLGSALHNAGMFLGTNQVCLRIKKQRADHNKGFGEFGPP